MNTIDVVKPLKGNSGSQERRGLHLDKNSASGGGIGVSYSSVVLGGGINPNAKQAHFASVKNADFVDPRSRASTELHSYQ